MKQALAEISFKAFVIEWRGLAPVYFVVLPDQHFGEVRHVARLAAMVGVAHL